ncbi:hypothetical protein GGS21DRAFT_491097 [Xylaria nigripes]|nr:hypothetical protein GGS21DRAFT_491097 [Xylaria nigripes]
MVAAHSGDDWAKTKDWVHHRSLIIALYRDQNKTLKETRMIMEEKHQFHATTRMYKSRFEKWGIEKKIKSRDAVEIHRQLSLRAKAGKKYSVAYVGGRKITNDRLQRYRYRAHPKIVDQFLMIDEELAIPTEQISAPSRVVCRTPSPAPEDPPTLSPQLADPIDLKVPHECMQILRNYIATSVEAGAWQASDTAPVPDAFTWAHYLAMSQGLIAHRRINEGVALLQICGYQYKTQLRNPDPFFWLATYKAALLLSYKDMSLGEKFFRFASSSCSRILLPDHPFNQVWSRLMVTGLPGLQRYAAALFQSYLMIWKQQVGLLPLDETRLVQMGFVFIQLQCSGMISYNFAKETLEAMMDLLSCSVFSQFLLQEAKFRMACLFLEQNRLDEAEAVTGQILTWLDSLHKPEDTEFVHLLCKCLWTMFEIKEKKGNLDEASATGLRLVRLCRDTYGLVHLQTIDAVSALESFYKRHKMDDGVSAASMDFQTCWQAFYRTAIRTKGFPHTINHPWLHRCVELAEDQGLIQQAVDLLSHCSLQEV